MDTLLQLAVALSSLTGLLTQVQAQTANNAILYTQPTAVLADTQPLIFHNNDGITEKNVWRIMDGLIQCESSGKREAYNPKDTDGLPAIGELQYKQKTWDMWSKESGIIGNPMNRKNAIEMTRWALLNGKIKSWGCAKQGLSAIE